MLWPEVLEHIKARPLTGYGFGRGILRQSLSDDLKRPLQWHAHNLFLDTLLQVGIPGLLLLLLLLGATLREGWRMMRVPDDLSVACGLAVIGVVAGMVVRNMTDTLWVRQNALFYWGVLAVLFALGRRPAARAGR
jgi:O-antigen ligase